WPTTHGTNLCTIQHYFGGLHSYIMQIFVPWLVKVENNSIVGIEWEAEAGASSQKSLEGQILFSIAATELHNSEDRKISFTCCPSSSDPHQCTLEKKSRGEFVQKCGSVQRHLSIIRQRMNPNMPFSDYQRTSTMKAIFLNSVLEDDGLIHKPLIVPNKKNIPKGLLDEEGNIFSQVIEPGLFKGNYDEVYQGVQLLLFRFKNDEENEIEGIKITGDTKVPASKISVKVNLRFPVLPNELQQKSLAELKKIDPQQTHKPTSSFLEQAFFLPEDIHPVENLPSSCKARYHGFGQIADSGFQGPMFSPVHIVFFNNDIIGVIWLDLNYLSVFHRIHINFEKHLNTNIRSIL
ncbi:unnamed protein product, partial [Meganyctiphanes norvegica]